MAPKKFAVGSVNEVSISDIVRKRYRTLDKGHVETLAADMKTNGYNPRYPVPVYYNAEDKLESFGGEHRNEGALSAGLDKVFVIIHAPPANASDAWRLAIADNAHVGNGATMARMAVCYLQALKEDKQPTPKPATLASALKCKQASAEKYITVFKVSHTSLIRHFIDNPGFTFQKLEAFVQANPDKSVQSERVAAGKLEVPKKYQPLVRGDTVTELKYLSGAFSDGKDLVAWLTSENEAEATAALSRLKGSAKRYYDDCDVQASKDAA